MSDVDVPPPVVFCHFSSVVGMQRQCKTPTEIEQMF